MVLQNDVVKIGDLGIAKLLKSTMAAKTQIGTPHYMPPEIWRNRWVGRAGARTRAQAYTTALHSGRACCACRTPAPLPATCCRAGPTASNRTRGP